MTSRTRQTLAIGTMLGIIGVAAVRPIGAAADPVNRTVFVTVTDSKGAPVSDLTAADFKVKEGGKDREIVKAEPAKTLPRLALMVEERLAADQGARVGLFEFVKRMNGAAEDLLDHRGAAQYDDRAVRHRPNTLLKGINELSLNSQPTSNLTEGINDMARIFEKDRPGRPVMVVVGFSGGQAGGASASSILTQIRQSGVTHV